MTRTTMFCKEFLVLPSITDSVKSMSCYSPVTNSYLGTFDKKNITKNQE